tara:strand:+ start:142 stop:330 length:189 start_codon:yes stop_codon:yes gene_type:complete
MIKKTKNKKKVFKGELGYGTKKKALDDMGKDNIDFDDLNDMFINEERFNYESPIDIDLDCLD